MCLQALLFWPSISRAHLDRTAQTEPGLVDYYHKIIFKLLHLIFFLLTKMNDFLSCWKNQNKFLNLLKLWWAYHSEISVRKFSVYVLRDQSHHTIIIIHFYSLLYGPWFLGKWNYENMYISILLKLSSWCVLIFISGLREASDFNINLLFL